ncbi:MAG: hypothetical protein JF615_07525, partial [Asticcacaulis sp.]|nr:hypothetical protein [Asticcacaulis sp.]
MTDSAACSGGKERPYTHTMADVLFSSLVDRLHPCGPVLNESQSAYVMDSLYEVARAEGWADTLSAAEPALLPIVS